MARKGRLGRQGDSLRMSPKEWRTSTSAAYRVKVYSASFGLWLSFNMLSSLWSNSFQIDKNYSLLLILAIIAFIKCSYQVVFSSGFLTVRIIGMSVANINLYKPLSIVSNKDDVLVVEHKDGSRFSIKTCLLSDEGRRLIRKSIYPHSGNSQRPSFLNGNDQMSLSEDQGEPNYLRAAWISAFMAFAVVASYSVEVLLIPSQGKVATLNDYPLLFHVACGLSLSISVLIMIWSFWKASRAQ